MDPGDLTDPDRLTDAERLAREISRRDQRMIDGVTERGVRSLRDRWAVEGHSESRPVLSHPATAYALPPHAKKILPPTVLADLEQILAEVRAVNEEFVGLDETVAGLLLANDELVLDIRARLRRWAEAYTSARLAKPSPRDGGNQVARFRRIYTELLPAIEEVLTRSGSVNHAAMGEVADYAAWLLFQGTWADRLEWDPLCGPLEKRWRIAGPPADADYCMEIVRLYAWVSAHDVVGTYRAFGRAGGLAPRAADARERLAELAAEIRGVRPFVIRDHNPEKCAAEVAPGLVASWFWGGSQQLGVVAIHDDERRRVTELKAHAFSTTLRVDHDGVLASEFAPWIDMATILEKEPDPLAVNVAVLEALHARLLDVFAKVDLEAAYGRVREAAAGAAGEQAPTQEAVAATVAAAEAAGAAVGEADAVPERPRVRVPTLRLERFLAILERLGCEVRQGKGSEVVAYRPGGRIARIGRHTKNREVPSTLVQRVLHQVGVSLAEWVRAVGR